MKTEVVEGLAEIGDVEETVVVPFQVVPPLTPQLTEVLATLGRIFVQSVMAPVKSEFRMLFVSFGRFAARSEPTVRPCTVCSSWSRPRLTAAEKMTSMELKDVAVVVAVLSESWKIAAS